MEDEEKDYKRNVNNITTDNLFQSPLTINAQNLDANVTNERPIDVEIHAETINESKGLSIQSTISDSAHYNSEEQVDTISDSKE